MVVEVRVKLGPTAPRRSAERRHAIESDLRRDVRAGQLRTVYQPQVDMRTGRVVGAEALVRWTHPRFGPISPAEFVPIAEESDLVREITALVVDDAIRTHVRLRASGAPLRSISVNASTRDLVDLVFLDRLTRGARDAALPPHSFCIEVTETHLLGKGCEAPAILHEAIRRGFYVSVDDFGTGYSSLGRLKDLPVEVLKIDRSFVSGLGIDDRDTAIVASIMGLASAMGLHAIAEGVETPQQAAALVALGCDIAQGFLYSPPVEVDRLVELALAPRGTDRPLRRRRRLREVLWGRAMPVSGSFWLVDELMHQLGIRTEPDAADPEGCW